jgi:hypothetical protein
MISEFIGDIKALRKLITRNKSININSKSPKAKAQSIAKKYFEYCHQYLVEKKIVGDQNQKLPELFQDLLRLTQGNNGKKSYLLNIRSIEVLLKDALIKDASSPTSGPRLDSRDKAIIETLNSIVPSAGLCYTQAVTDLNICTHKISFRGTAVELREALRETLDHLAPDKDVMTMPNFKLEGSQTKPTMKQKVVYILKNRNVNDTKRATTEKSLEMIELMMGALTRAVYDRASLSTHVETTKKEVVGIKRAVDLVFHEILELS